MKVKRIAYILVALILVVGLAASLVGCKSGKADTEKAKLGLSESAAKPPASSDGSGTAASAVTTPTGKAESPGTSPAGGGEASADDAGDAGDSGGSTNSGGAGTGSAGGSAGSAAVPTMKIRVMWWNDTGDNPPSNAEIVYGTSSYKPASGRSDYGSIGPCPVGKKIQVLVYPDGRSGKRIAANILIAADMVPNSERDAIHVEVKDGTVRVLGNPVLNFTQSFDR